MPVNDQLWQQPPGNAQDSVFTQFLQLWSRWAALSCLGLLAEVAGWHCNCGAVPVASENFLHTRRRGAHFPQFAKHAT